MPLSRVYACCTAFTDKSLFFAGQHSMKMEGLADHPLENALALLFELDLMPSWHNLMTRAQKLLSPSDYLSYNHAVHWMPFPFSNMDCLFTAHAYDLSQVLTPAPLFPS